MDVIRSRCVNDTTPHSGDFAPADNDLHPRYPLEECGACHKAFCEDCWTDHATLPGHGEAASLTPEILDTVYDIVRNHPQPVVLDSFKQHDLTDTDLINS